MKILACNSNRPLAEAISNYLDLPLTKASVRRFSDMEVFVEIHENVRGEDVFVIQSTSFPANDHLMELLVSLDALKRGSARRVTAVIPYYGYARQDRKSGPRTPISAKLVANMITEAGAAAVDAYVSHGVLSGGAVSRVIASPIEMLVITDSIVATEAVRTADNIRQVTIAPLMAEAIRRISEERSVSSLFD